MRVKERKGERQIGRGKDKIKRKGSKNECLREGEKATRMGRSLLDTNGFIKDSILNDKKLKRNMII